MLITTLAKAQTSLKIYNEFLVEHKTNYQYYDPATKQTFKDYSVHTSILQPTFAIQWKARKNKNFHQFEINRFKINAVENQQELSDSAKTTVIAGTKKNNINIALRYEFMKQITSSKFGKNQLFVGFGVNPFFEREQTNPYNSIQYPVTFASAGLRLFITPRYIHHFNKRFYIDVNLPIDIANMNYVYTNVHYTNSNGQNVNEYTIFDFEGLPKYFSARVGLGIKL